MLALLAGCAANQPPTARPDSASATVAQDCDEVARSHAAEQRLAEAVAAANRCADTNPTNPGTRDTQGELLLLAGDLSAAERAFQAALALRSDFAIAHHGLASVLFHRGDPGGGVAALNAGIANTPQIDPSYTRTRLLEDLAVAHFAAGREHEAFDAMRASVLAQQLDAPTTEAVTRIGRARLLLHARRWREALAELEAARVPGAQPYVDVAARAISIRAWVGAGELARAVEMLSSLTRELGADHVRVLEPAFAIALAHRDLGAATAALARLAALDPYAAERAELDLAHALRAAGREAEARTHLAQLAKRYLRSAESAGLRRAAEALLAARPQG